MVDGGAGAGTTAGVASQQPAAARAVAPAWRRAAARTIDAALLCPPALWALWQAANLPAMGMGGIVVLLGLFALAAVWAVVGWTVYDVMAISRFGATVGKRLLGLQVVTVDGARPGAAVAFVRALGSTVPFTLLLAVTSMGGRGLSPVALLLAGWWGAQIGRGDGRTGYDRRAGTVVVPRGQAAAVAAAPLACGHPQPGRDAGRVVFGGAALVAALIAHAVGRADAGRSAVALAVFAVGVAGVWRLWAGSPHRRAATLIAAGTAAALSLSLVLQLADAPAAVGDRLGDELVAAGFAPLPPGTRSEHCHLGWQRADCPRAGQPEFRSSGTLEQALADLVTAARRAGLTTSGEPLDPYATQPGYTSIVVRSGRTLLVVSVTTPAWDRSTLPPETVAVWWSER